MRSVTTHDAEWTPEDFALLMAWDELKAADCSGCGRALSETTEAHERDYEVEAVTCGACAARERAASIRRQELDGAGDYGTLFSVSRKSDPLD